MKKKIDYFAPINLVISMLKINFFLFYGIISKIYKVKYKNILSIILSI